MNNTTPISSWRNRSPGDLDRELAEVFSTPVEPAIARASAAAAEWARTPLAERAVCLQAAQTRLAMEKDALAEGISVETGKPITEARGEVGAVLAKFDLTIADAEAHCAAREVAGGAHPAWVRQRARGPAAVVGPFNFPLHLANGALVAHLAAGNSVIFKPSPLSALVAARYAELVSPCFPSGVFELVQGGAHEGRVVCVDARVRAVCFTGSVPVGQALARECAADFSKDLALELGGHNAVIICADADLELAARAVADGACLTCGQRCNATSRVIVEAAVAREFEPLLLTALAAWQPGDPLDAVTKLGPLISAAAVARYEALTSQPGDWILPGKTVPQLGGRRGHWVMPAVRRGRLIEEAETFVPVLELETAAYLDAAVASANATRFGLSASVFTRSRARFESVADALHAGNVYANLPTTFSPSTLPFGGWGQSGNGRPGGRGFIRWTTQEQAVQVAAESFTDR